MNFNFKESLVKGQASASLVQKNQKELNEIYNELTKTLSDHFGFEVSLEHRLEYKGMESGNSIVALGAAFNAWVDPKKVATGYTVLSLVSKETDSSKVSMFRYKESDDVYPVTVLINKDKILCYNQEEFAHSINKALENPRLNLELMDFKSQVEEALKEGTEDSESE